MVVSSLSENSVAVAEGRLRQAALSTDLLPPVLLAALLPGDKAPEGEKTRLVLESRALLIPPNSANAKCVQGESRSRAATWNPDFPFRRQSAFASPIPSQTAGPLIPSGDRPQPTQLRGDRAQRTAVNEADVYDVDAKRRE